MLDWRQAICCSGFRNLLAVSLCVLTVSLRVCADDSGKEAAVGTPTKELPIAGEVFSVEGHTAFLILPTHKSTGNATPWVWYAPTITNYPCDDEKWMFEKFLAAGLAIAGIDVGESYGSPQGRVLYSALYRELVTKRGLSKKACLLARSRGGLMVYNWAVENPASVACIAGIYPVCDITSYPGIKSACGAYGMSEEELTAQLSRHNPVDRVKPLAKARVPIFHIHGDSDTLVPLEQNSGKLAERYRRFGGVMTLMVIKGRGHDHWPGWVQCQELVDFVIAHAGEGKGSRQSNGTTSGKARPARETGKDSSCP